MATVPGNPRGTEEGLGILEVETSDLAGSLVIGVDQRTPKNTYHGPCNCEEVGIPDSERARFAISSYAQDDSGPL